jgi:hypothetical protein
VEKLAILLGVLLVEEMEHLLGQQLVVLLDVLLAHVLEQM